MLWLFTMLKSKKFSANNNKGNHNNNNKEGATSEYPATHLHVIE